MKTSTLYSLASFALALLGKSALAQPSENVTEVIISNADADNIDLSVLDFLNDALAEIATTYETPPAVRRNTLTANVVDVHSHVVPAWYKALVPTTGGNPTPAWDIDSYLSFMNSEGIARSIFSFSAPGANVYQGSKGLTVALARLMNEQAAAYCRANPSRLNFYAVVPLPYTQEAITEAKYALNQLGAVGIMLTSNFEGLYLGNPQFKPFFDAINKLGGRQILFIHPGAPYIKVRNKLVEANPTLYPTGTIEFYFETARTLMDLTLTQTIHNFTNIHYVIPHVGGAYPAVIDRVLKTVPALYDSSLNIYNTRFWWDSAGPTYFHQVSGLLGYGLPKTQLLFGTDFPYAPSFTQPGSLAAVQNSPLLSPLERVALFTTNPQNLFGSKIDCTYPESWRFN
ncbi:putative amidohydrolase [Lyophyllum shimeji]|uniref:Amidohydrolase n=1 Tax=Lyophyllum shimeji TaxID=47721 RepID=A0A9P3PEP2_LYOSH|nr:putative amidohydrolase [Lyophyllum shimeji]